jgi:hypothetical protein
LYDVVQFEDKLIVLTRNIAVMQGESQMSTDLKAAFEDIKNQVLQGKAMEVFEQYYATMW